VSAIVPCFTFGENELFDVLDLGALTKGINKFTKAVAGMTVPFMTSMVPKRKDLTTVMGKPVLLSKLKEATVEGQIEELHAMYVKGLQEVYDKHRKEFGYGELRIAE
jgi:hypothetical protein